MQDRPDLIQSELAGLAFDSLQQVFRKGDIALAFETPGLPFEQDQMVWTVVDPAAGGPQSDYAIVSIVRSKGCVQVRSRQDVGLDAALHKLRRGLAGVDEILRRELAQVHKEARQLRVVPAAVHVKDLLLEPRVDVEQQKKHMQRLGVRQPRQARLEGGHRARALLEESALQMRERPARDVKQRCAVARVEEGQDAVGEVPLRVGRRLPRGRPAGADCELFSLSPGHCRRRALRLQRCVSSPEKSLCFPLPTLAHETDDAPTEPTKQFALLERHILRIHERPIFAHSPVVVMVERNLGFEAEHHQRALHGVPYTQHRIDHQAQRYGILTTEETKLAMMTLANNMLRDKRINVLDPLLSEDAPAARRRLREQLGIYSFQYKAAANAFGKQRVALNGKVGGMKDDVCIALQLAVYYSQRPELYQ